MNTLYLSLGTNMGDRQSNLDTAITLIASRIGTVCSISEAIRTEPWGFDSPSFFLNMAAQVLTGLTPFEVLHVTQDIERLMGRTEKSVNGHYHDRIIDIDLLMMTDADGNDIIVNTRELTLPHRLMHLRKFVLEPLREIAPELVHPLTGKTISELSDSIE